MKTFFVKSRVSGRSWIVGGEVINGVLHGHVIRLTGESGDIDVCVIGANYFNLQIYPELYKMEEIHLTP